MGKLKQILAFLSLSPLQDYEPARKALQAELLRLGSDSVNARTLDDAPRRAVEGLLRPLICRTARQIVTLLGLELLGDVGKPLHAEVLGPLLAKYQGACTTEKTPGSKVQLACEDFAATSEMMDMLLAKKRAGDRKSWLESKGNMAQVLA